MKVLFILLRLLLFYMLLRLFFKSIFLLMESFRNQPNTSERSHQETSKNTFDDRDVIDVEFEEIK